MELLQYWGIIRRWWWLLVLTTLVAAISAFAVSVRMTPVYRATAQVLIQQASNPANLTSYSDILTSERLARTYSKLLTTRPVLEQTLKELQLTQQLSPDTLKKHISVQPVRDTTLIQLSVDDTNPARAVSLANKIPQVFARYNQNIQLARYQDSKKNLQTQLKRLEDELAQDQAQLATLKADNTSDPTDVTRLETQITTLQSSYSNLLRQYEEVRLAEAQSLDNIVLSEPATRAIKVRPRTLLNTLLAAIVGLMLGLGAVFLIEYLDDTVKTPDDIVRLGDIPILSGINQVEDAQDNQLITHKIPKSPISEAFRILRTNIQFASVDTSLRTLLITGPGPSAGKSFMTANLGVVMAQQGRRVVIVDADLRKPRQHKIFGLPNNVGLTTLLLVENEENISPFLQETEVENLRVLTSGTIPPNPSELLGSRRMGELIETLLQDADVILFDTPPALAVTDAIVLSKKTNGVLVIARSGHTRQPALLQALMELERAGAHVLGVALNMLPRKRAGYYYSYYYYSYGHYDEYYSDGDTARENGRRPSRKSSGHKGKNPLYGVLC